MKKHNFIYISIFILIELLSISCKKGGKSDSEKITLDSLHITEFAQKIEQNVIKGDTVFYAKAFDKKGLKLKLQQN